MRYMEKLERYATTPSLKVFNLCFQWRMTPMSENKTVQFFEHVNNKQPKAYKGEEMKH